MTMSASASPPASSSLASTSTLGTLARVLPLRESHLRADARGGVCRIVLEQRFENPHDEPLHVTYVLPLPHEAAVGAFAFTIGDRTIEGEIDTMGKARARFEDAIASGHTAALLEEERSTVFSQELGNIPARTSVVARITLDTRVVFVAGSPTERGKWELRFPLTVAPRYLGAPGRTPDTDRLALDVTEISSVAPRIGLTLLIGDPLAQGRSPESPSHSLQCARSATRTSSRSRSVEMVVWPSIAMSWCAGMPSQTRRRRPRPFTWPKARTRCMPS